MDKQTFARSFIDALHALEGGDESQATQVAALFAEDARLTNAALQQVDKERQGRADIETFWQEYRRSFGTVRSEFAHITTDDDAIGLFWTTTGTDTEGNDISYDGVSLLVVGDGEQITYFQGYYDTRALSRTVNSEE